MRNASIAWRSLKIATVVLALAAAVAAVAGVRHAQEETKAKPFRVVTTFTVIADMARNVAGEAAIVESITKPGAEIHNYQPTPGDILKAQDADLVIWDPEATFRVEPPILQHRHKVTPYAGEELHGVVQATYLRGEKVYERGSFPAEARGRWLKREG